MADLAKQSEEPNITPHLKELIGDLLTFVEYVTEEQQQRLLDVLQEWIRGERREHSRKPCCIEIGYYTTQERMFTDFIENISASGEFIRTSAPLSVGQQLELILPCPSKKEPVAITGEVVWKSELGVGVRFTAVSDELRKMFTSLLTVGKPYGTSC